jgi:predicted SAM-dependent methyltransferase
VLTNKEGDHSFGKAFKSWEMMKRNNFLNLGCGMRFHESWTNVDFKAAHKSILEYDLTKGIPFNDNSFEVVYHSHVLEHFSKNDGYYFLKECYRVLKLNGVLRIAVPDLEKIVREYLNCVDNISSGLQKSYANYDWILLELYDQAVRSKTGGGMLDYLSQETIPNEDFVKLRIGEEALKIKEYKDYLNRDITSISVNKPSYGLIAMKKLRAKAFRFFFNKEYQKQKWLDNNIRMFELGLFRSSGEIHLWMYDRISISRLLSMIGFKDIRIVTPFISQITNWEKFELESKNGLVFKPDSLFVEAKK